MFVVVRDIAPSEQHNPAARFNAFQKHLHAVWKELKKPANTQLQGLSDYFQVQACLQSTDMALMYHVVTFVQPCLQVEFAALPFKRYREEQFAAETQKLAVRIAQIGESKTQSPHGLGACCSPGTQSFVKILFDVS